MNRIRPFVALLLLFSLALSMSACRPIDTQTHMPSAEHPLTYLVLGFDDAAENTDVMFLVAFDPETPRTAIIQIPRDTYLSTGYAQNKINQIFASRRAAGDTERDALAYVRDLLSGTLGIPLTATVGISMSAFRRTVDAIGGVDMTLTEDIVLDTEDGREPLALSAGAHHIDGETAERFVRYRRRYARGDLGRMDAQKVFLSAFFHTVKDTLGAREMIALADVLSDAYVTDVPLLTLVQTAINYLPSLRRTSLCYATLPGEATQSDTGLWYYVVNRKGASELFARYFGAEQTAFDPAHRLTREEDIAFDNIYSDTRFSYRVYDDGELSQMHVPRT